MKTARQLLVEAAGLLTEIAKGEVSGGCLSAGILPEELIERAGRWLQEELDEASLEDGVQPSEDVEPPTDERWFAAYLRAVETFGPLRKACLMWSGDPAELCHEFAKAVADRALAAARTQAKESLAKYPRTE